jgi:hypothetical protein
MISKVVTLAGLFEQVRVCPEELRAAVDAPHSVIFCTKDEKPQEKNWKSAAYASL